MKITKELYKTFLNKSSCECQNDLNLINRENVILFFKDLFKSLFLDYFYLNPTIEDLDLLLTKSKNELLSSFNNPQKEIKDKIDSFFLKVIEIKELLLLDLEAIYKGDPSSNNINEIILTFNPFYAICAYRVAHLLYLLDLKFIAKIISEFAHSKTGIDISSGAKIGKSFFIDHGTGIVIGETCVIGDNCKIYQGVTLGALSLKEGRKLKNSKRHPTIEDNVTIYSGASILGGDTIIGKNSIIGSNVFITSSIKPNSKVIYNSNIENINK